jgi:DNA mismatch endonuclease (patch repair protein)
MVIGKALHKLVGTSNNPEGMVTSKKFETTPERSALMAAVHSKNTGPELFVRRLAHRLGYRFRVHGRRLPGRPDIVFPSRHKVIFVHGCFWHRHSCKTGQRVVKTRQEFWTAKFERNIARDARTELELMKRGWKTLIIWECEIDRERDLAKKLRTFLGPTQDSRIVNRKNSGANAGGS